ncbi:hypothetical protein C9J01_12905 [Photobacterium rosenbergii]|uniref:Lipoprotein n=1 Tax=Photobacterium rosenbergii TaxID=294936 RepID=A0A2T3NEE3_9GAMM|nr:hypothetical protein [Photobacterium rosenbergii]PSW12746.1 hypothetical protein C9J01_12905 [Photobacterium rosenbergii]
MGLNKLILAAALTLLLSGCEKSPISQIKNSDFCDGSDLSFEDTLSLKYNENIEWEQFQSSNGNDIVEVRAKSKSGETFRMQYLIQETKSGKVVPKPGYIEKNGEKSSLFGLLFLCM